MKKRYRLVVCTLAGALVAVGLATNAAAQAGLGDAGAVVGDSLREASAAVEAAHRADLAESILSQREAEAGRPFDARYRAFLKASLAELPEGRLESLQGAGSLVSLREAMTPNALGDSGADLVYTPVTPCRVFDTRDPAAGILVGNTQRNFFVAGTSGFPTQGGNSGGCGIPFGPATSVIINFAAVTPTGGGNLRAWAVANPQPAAPLAAVMNFSPALVALANGIAVPICNVAVTSCASGDLRLQADNNSVHVVGDVVGYFRSTGQVLPGGNLPTGSTLRGFWGQGWTANAAGDFHETYLAFGFTLASAPTAHFIGFGTTPPAGCPGTSANPQADPGHLCVYEDNTGNTNTKLVCSSSSCPGATRWGAQVRGSSAAAGGTSWMRGTWAVTAP